MTNDIQDQNTNQEKEETSKKADSKLQKIIDEIGKLSVLELSDLVKTMEEQFGVQAIAAAPVVGSANAQTSTNEGSQSEEKSTFTVVMVDSGTNKINVIKALREIKPELGLKEAKDMTEQLPAEVLTDAKKEQAEEAKKKLEEAGAKVELK